MSSKVQVNHTFSIPSYLRSSEQPEPIFNNYYSTEPIHQAPHFNFDLRRTQPTTSVINKPNQNVIHSFNFLVLKNN